MSYLTVTQNRAIAQTDIQRAGQLPKEPNSNRVIAQH